MLGADQLRDLLHRERQAAIRADTGTLVELQEEKRSLLARATLSDDERDSLAEVARENLALMRHLQRCFESALGLCSASVYGVTGASASPAMRRDWGAR